MRAILIRSSSCPIRLALQVSDAYTVLIREKKLPLSLLEDPDKKKDGKQARANLLTMQPFQQTFGPGARRKRPKLLADDLAELQQRTEETTGAYQEKAGDDGELKDFMRDPVFDKGQSRRIWAELYKAGLSSCSPPLTQGGSASRPFR